jgi:hypothetical protein
MVLEMERRMAPSLECAAAAEVIWNIRMIA